MPAVTRREQRQKLYSAPRCQDSTPATGTEPKGPVIPIFLAEPALITLTVFLSFSDVPLSHPRASSDGTETEGRREREDGECQQSSASPHQPALRASPAGGRQKEISYLVASMTLRQSSATPFSGGRGCTATPLLQPPLSVKPIDGPQLWAVAGFKGHIPISHWIKSSLWRVV